MIYPHHAAKMTAIIHKVGYRPAMAALKRLPSLESISRLQDDSSESELDNGYDRQDEDVDIMANVDAIVKDALQAKTIFRVMQQERHLAQSSSEDVIRVDQYIISSAIFYISSMSTMHF